MTEKTYRICPLCTGSDRSAALQRNDAKGQQQTQRVFWRRGQLEYLRPQFRMAPIIGPRSRPFSVSTYSARGGLIE